MKESMKIVLFALIMGVPVMTLAQAEANLRSSDLDRTISQYMASKMIDGAEVGLMLCEDLQGRWVICSGDISETALGVITSAPYVTVNKPKKAGDSHHVFDAYVSVSNGPIEAGDYLKPVAEGRLGRCTKDEVPFAVGVALEPAFGDTKIKVKVFKR